MNKSLFCILASLLYSSAIALAPINLFRPSDPFLIPENLGCTPFQFTIGYEGTLNVKGFQDEHEECNQVKSDCSDTSKEKGSKSKSSKSKDRSVRRSLDEGGCSKDEDAQVNILQIYQHKQNALAAFKGFEAHTTQGKLAQVFTRHDENGHHGFFVPSGCFKVPLNLMFAARYNIPCGVTFGLFLPVYIMELDHVRWKEKVHKELFKERGEERLIERVCDLAGLNLHGWKRTGIGDLLGQVMWTRSFPQARPLLSNVQVQLRFGVSAPTGKKQDEDKILAIPFGNDGSWGVQVAGDLQLTFCRWLRGGVDAEFLYLFGNTKQRRVRTDCHQTDLLFLTKVSAFREFGFSQQYNLFLETCNFFRGLRLKVNYQYLKRNEDRLFICNDRIDTSVVNNAESLQDWTAHSLIFGLWYDFGYDMPQSPVLPALSGWFKWGFNGKRALLADTLGLTFTLSF